MSVNGISNVGSYDSTTYASSSSTTKSSSTSDSQYGKDAAAVYEKSDDAKSASTNKALAEKLKADAQNRVNQMQSLVYDMMNKQGVAFTKADDMWKFLASGNYTVDAKTAQEAQDAISEDGYWGVNQTSQRIFDFAVSLSGGDSDKMDEMLAAFKKGFEQATKSWGKSLPDISSQTYDAVLKKFDDYKNSQNVEQ
jgi:hypothetical protein